MAENKTFYLTTAIAYPNAAPHAGHALEIVEADAIARFQRLLGKDVFFLTGTDEHGIKNWQTAKKEGKEIKSFLDENVAIFKKLYKKLNISNDYFIRTTDKKIHHPGAKKLWTALVEAGDIYKQEYDGLYCAGCEASKTERDLENGKCLNHPTRKIETFKEENYFFRLSKYAELIAKKIEKDEFKVTPQIRKNEILSFLKEAKDISFSRPKTSLPWGIEVPDDKEQVMYVWCDALANYLTGAGYGRDEKQYKKLWPPNAQVIGKDILRFHAAFWPAMLLSAQLELPKELLVHGFILSRGTKMGKSTGNVVEPFEQMEKYGIDPFRYYLLEAMPLGDDGDYTEELITEKTNSELVGNLSNFCYRVLSFTNKNFKSEITNVDTAFLKKLSEKYEEIKKAYEHYDFKAALGGILSVAAAGNKYFQDNEPWKLIKTDKEKAQEIISTSVNIAKSLSILLQPAIPEFSKQLQKQLKLKDLKWVDLESILKNTKIRKAEIIFKKVELQETKEEVHRVETQVEKDAKKIGINAVFVQLNGVKVKKKHEGLERIKNQLAQNIKDGKYSHQKNSLGYRKLYEACNVLGYNYGAEHLITLINEKGKLPTINTLVDAYNVVAAKYRISIGAHDVAKIAGKVTIKLAKGDEKYTPLGEKELQKVNKGEYICADHEKVLCWLDVKQGNDTFVDNTTENVLLYIQGNENISESELTTHLKEACKLIKNFCGGTYSLPEPQEESFPLDLRVAKIESVADHPDAEKLLVLQLDLGEKRQIVAGLKGHYSQEELKGKKIIVVANLEKAKLRGVESQAMLLAADDGKTIEVLETEGTPGDRVTFGKLKNNTNKITFKDFLGLKMVVKNKEVFYKGKRLEVHGTPINATSEGARIR